MSSTTETFTLDQLRQQYDEATARRPLSYLSPYQRALDTLRSWQAQDDWYAQQIAVEEDRLFNAGFLDPEITFSGFWSQGDGACFTASVAPNGVFKSEAWNMSYPNWHEQYPEYMRYRVLCDMHLLNPDEHFVDLCFSIGRCSTQYCHSGTMQIDDMSMVRLDGSPVNAHAVCEELDRLRDAILQHARALANEIYHRLEQEYNYLTSDAYLLELARDMNYQFDEDGNFITKF